MLQNTAEAQQKNFKCKGEIFVKTSVHIPLLECMGTTNFSFESNNFPPVPVFLIIN